jgi:hypothetical protein
VLFRPELKQLKTRQREPAGFDRVNNQTSARALADAVRLVEKVIAVAQRLLGVLINRNADRLDVLVEIEQPEKQSIEAFNAR